MDIFLVAFKLILAAVLGAIIGVEREIKNRAAGFRTHIIVSVGACLIMLIGIDAIGDISTPSKRYCKACRSSCEWNWVFGSRYYSSKKNGVSGLTTAATLWLSGAIGLAVGIGYYEGAIIATVICLITLVSLKGISDLINNKTTKSYIMVFDTSNFNQKSFYEFTQEEGVEVRKIDIIDEDMDDKSMIESTLSFHKNYDIGRFFKKLKSDLHLKSVKLSEKED